MGNVGKDVARLGTVDVLVRPPPARRAQEVLGDVPVGDEETVAGTRVHILSRSSADRAPGRVIPNQANAPSSGRVTFHSIQPRLAIPLLRSVDNMCH